MGQGKNQMVVKNYLESDENRNVKTTQPLKKKEILLFVTTRIHLEGIMLSNDLICVSVSLYWCLVITLFIFL